MPNSATSNRMLMIALAAIASYWVLPVFATGLQLQIVFNSLVFGIATTILVTWGPATYYALRGRAWGENQNIVAVFVVWLVVWLQRLYSIIFVSLDRPWWLMNSALPAFMAYMFGMAGVLFLVAPASIKHADTEQKAYYWRLAIAGIFGAAGAAASYYLQLAGFDR